MRVRAKAEEAFERRGSLQCGVPNRTSNLVLVTINASVLSSWTILLDSMEDVPLTIGLSQHGVDFSHRGMTPGTSFNKNCQDAASS